MSQGYELESDSPESRLAAALRSADLSSVEAVPDDADGRLLDALLGMRTEYRTTALGPDAEATSRMLQAVRAGMTRAEGRLSLAWILRSTGAALRARPAWAVAALVLMVLVPVVLLTPTGRITETVARSDGATLVYEAPDGSTITLRPHSVLASDGTRSYRLRGEAFFDVVHDPAFDFRVATADASIEVLGTRFNVRAYDGTTEVFVADGRVRFAGPGDSASLVLTAGRAARMTGEGPGDASWITEDAALDWMSGEIVLDSQPLRSVIAEIEHHFDVHIELPTGSIDDQLSGRILLEDLQQALTDLGIVVGGEFVRTGAGSYRLIIR